MKQEKTKYRSPLLELNDLIARDGDVFVTRTAEVQGLAYSDGDVEEQYIYRVIASAKDLSSQSEELRHFERDWASECHLSSKRANVYRGLDFSGFHNVLEIGSGCGAITRFLGEQGGVVDAVEGSLRRAEITRMRCRDLENVTVIQSDFNVLHLPKDYYDLAVLTGVIEYAGKFSKDGEDPMEAAVAMLGRITGSLRPGGSLVIAIENRLGFKYIAGAGEDHFSRPWVGLGNYPDCDDPEYKEKKGIRTWDKGQWQQIIQGLEGVRDSWYYPFPDYKLATSLLSEEFIQTSPSAGSCLSRIRSRDYTAVWYPPLNEQLFWQTAAAAGTIEQMANSFVIVLQREDPDASLHELLPFDFVHFSGHNRKAEYQVMVEKKRGRGSVDKIPLGENSKAVGDTVVIQHLASESFFEGELLSVYWGNTLRACISAETFDGLLKQYHEYVIRECELHSAGQLLDLLPFNIIVDGDGNWHSFDQEWRTENDVSPQFIFFRAVFYFYLEHKEILRPFCAKQLITNGWEFVEYCLSRLLYSGEYDLQEFVAFENTIQSAISRPESFSPIESALDSPPTDTGDSWSWERASLTWGEDAAVSQAVSCFQTDDGQCIVFELPQEARLSPYIQLSLGIPEQEVGLVFRLRSFSLYARRSDGSSKKVLPVESAETAPPLIKLTGLTFCREVQGGVFVVDEKEPQILHFLFPEIIDDEKVLALDCEVVLEFLGGNGAQVFLEQCRLEKRNLSIMLEETQHKLAQIEHSRGWQIILGLKRVKEKMTALFGQKERLVLEGAPDAPGEVRLKKGGSETARNREEENQGELISVVVGVYNTGEVELRRTINSVMNQSYRNWELIIIDSGSDNEMTLQALAGIKHPKIKVHCLKKSENLTMAMGRGVSLAGGNWLTFLGHFDRLRPEALLSFAQEIGRHQPDVIFSDEEIIDRDGTVFAEKRKSEFLAGADDNNDVIGASLCIRRSLFEQAGGLDPEFDGVQLFDLVMRASRYTDKIVHLKKTVYQTRQCEPPTRDMLDRMEKYCKRARERSLNNR